MESNDKPLYDWKGQRGETWCEHLGPMEAMLRPIDAPLIEALALEGPCRVADIACGGGGTSAAVFEQAPAGSEVHGVDIHAGLIEVARGRTEHPRLSFEVGNIECVEPPEVPYDRLVSRFGTMFFQDPPRAFQRLRAWLSPSGRFAFAVWAAPAQNPWVSVVREAVERVVTIPPAQPDAPGPFRYAEPGLLASLLSEAGFSGVATQSWNGVLSVGGGVGAAEAADYALAAFSTYASLLQEAGPRKRDEARAGLRTAFAEHEVQGVVSLKAHAFVVTGSRGA